MILKFYGTKTLPDWIVKKWEKWEKKLPTKVNISKTINLHQEVLEMIDIHVFGDASLLGKCLAAYAVIRQSSTTKQGLIASKSRLSNKQLRIPSLELVAAQMVANLANNIRNSLQNYNIREVYGWSDSTVVLHFVHSRVKYINSKTPITWRYADTIQNPADIKTEGSNIENLAK